MLLGHPSQLPETGLEALGQRLEGLREAHVHRLHVRIREHQVIDHVWEGDPADGYLQVAHVGEVRLCRAARRMNLGEHHFDRRPMLHPPE